jgi:hypothetical protein
MKISEMIRADSVVEAVRPGLSRKKVIEKEKKEKEKRRKAKMKTLEKWVAYYKRAKKQVESHPRLLAKHQKKQNRNTAWHTQNLKWKAELKRAKKTMSDAKKKLKNYPELKKKAGIK